MEDIRLNGGILIDAIQHITPEAVKNSGLFEPYSIILATTATIGEHAMLIADSLANQQFTNFKIRKSQYNKFDPYYVYYYFFKIDEWCLTHTNAGGLLSVDIPSLKQKQFYTPCKKEQSKIASLFKLLDERITTQNKIIERYQSLIRALALKLTSQFKETRPLSDLVQYTPSTLKESDSQETGEVPVYGASGICGYVDFPLSDKDSILITKDGSGVGTIRYVSGQHAFVGTLASMSAKEGTFLPYVYFALMNLIFTAYKTGLAIPHIYFKDYGKAEIPCPVYEEQVRIATGLMEMEEKLGIEHSMLNNLQKQKNVLLKKLFI